MFPSWTCRHKVPVGIGYSYHITLIYHDTRTLEIEIRLTRISSGATKQQQEIVIQLLD